MRPPSAPSAWRSIPRARRTTPSSPRARRTDRTRARRPANRAPPSRLPPRNRPRPPGRGGKEGAAAPRALADAAVLRLRWDQPLPELARQAKARRELAPNAPLLLVFDWLNESRSRLLGADADAGWTAARIADFARACAQLAAAAHPDHFDV